MSDKEIFDSQRRALEEAFFNNQDQKLVQSLKEQAERAQLKEGLSSFGIKDPAVLEKLADLKISGETLAALSIVPLVEVAWCDGELDEKEKEAIVRAADGFGIAKGSPAHGLLVGWLQKAPSMDLLVAWEAYTKVLCEQFPEANRKKLKDELVGRAKQVAEAAGGFLGLMSKISPAEQRMLDRLSKAF